MTYRTAYEARMADSLPQFFMVLSDDSTYTQYRHSTLSGARSEAARLATVNPGTKFWVLAALGCALNPEPVKWIATTEGFDPHDKIPF